MFIAAHEVLINGGILLSGGDCHAVVRFPLKRDRAPYTAYRMMQPSARFTGLLVLFCLFK